MTNCNSCGNSLQTAQCWLNLKLATVYEDMYRCGCESTCIPMYVSGWYRYDGLHCVVLYMYCILYSVCTVCSLCLHVYVLYMYRVNVSGSR